MNVMTKQGQIDNVLTYEHVCDTTADMVNIPSQQITLGTVCIVLEGDSGGLEVYMANSKKEWKSLLTTSSSSDDDEENAPSPTPS